MGTGRRRSLAVFLAGLLLGGAVVAIGVRATSSGDSSSNSVPQAVASSAVPEATVPETPLPVPGSASGTTAPAEGVAPGSAVASTGPGQPGRDTGASAEVGPDAPPPDPRPSISPPPRTVDCQVAILAGPAPGMDNIRLLVTTTPSVQVLWARVEQEGRQTQGAIALAGGRGEQVVNGFTQAARVTVFADSTLDPATASCRAPAA